MARPWLYQRSMPSLSDFSTSASSTRPFRILGVQQIALGSTDKQGMTTLWEDIFGLKPHSNHRIERENVDEDILKVGVGVLGQVEIDLMQPIDPDKSPKVGAVKTTEAQFCFRFS